MDNLRLSRQGRIGTPTQGVSGTPAHRRPTTTTTTRTRLFGDENDDSNIFDKYYYAPSPFDESRESGPTEPEPSPSLVKPPAKWKSKKTVGWLILGVVLVVIIAIIGIVLWLVLRTGNGSGVKTPTHVTWTSFTTSDNGCGETMGWRWDINPNTTYDYTILDKDTNKTVASVTDNADPFAIIPSTVLGSTYHLSVRAVDKQSGKKSSAIKRTQTVKAAPTSAPTIRCITYNKSVNGCQDYVIMDLDDFATMQGTYKFTLQQAIGGNVGTLVQNRNGLVYQNMPLVVSDTHLRYVSYPINSNLLSVTGATVYITVHGGNDNGTTEKVALTII